MPTRYNAMIVPAKAMIDWNQSWLSHSAAPGNSALSAANDPATTGVPTCDRKLKMNLNTTQVSHSGTKVRRPVMR